MVEIGWLTFRGWSVNLKFINFIDFRPFWEARVTRGYPLR